MTIKANYDFLTLTEQIQLEASELRNALIDVVTQWTEKELEQGNTPHMGKFLDEYPEWDRNYLWDLIEAEIERAKLCWD